MGSVQAAIVIHGSHKTNVDENVLWNRKWFEGSFEKAIKTIATEIFASFFKIDQPFTHSTELSFFGSMNIFIINQTAGFEFHRTYHF